VAAGHRVSRAFRWSGTELEDWRDAAAFRHCASFIFVGEEFSGCGSFTTWRPMFHVSLLFGGYVDKAGGIDQSVIPDLGFLRAVFSFNLFNTAAPIPGACLMHA
jgi:hypothetical protein